MKPLSLDLAKVCIISSESGVLLAYYITWKGTFDLKSRAYRRLSPMKSIWRTF